MKHVMALHPHVARQRVANGIVAHVPHVQCARRVGQHLEDVIFLALGREWLGTIQFRILRPALEPLLLDCLRVVAVGASYDFGLLRHFRRLRFGFGHRCF